MTQIFVRPREGLQIRMPDGAGHLPAEGMEVELSLFWQRRAADGDVLVGSPHATPNKKKEA